MKPTIYLVPKQGGPVHFFSNIIDAAYFLRGKDVPGFIVVREGRQAITLGQTTYQGMLKELSMWEQSYAT
jgi:hypothetical protein